MKKIVDISFILILTFAVASAIAAQTKKPKKVVKPQPVVAATPQPTPQPQSVEVPAKSNERPSVDATTLNNLKANGAARSIQTSYTPVYFYEFTRPGFVYSHVLIEHDEHGKGKISFLKDGFDDLITDPIDLSPVTLANIDGALTALKFLDSSEDYQYAGRDFSNMGNVAITVKKNGRERTAKYNWTENKNAKILMDEYRRIGNEYTWRFEIASARENQPLLTPGLTDALDSYLERSEISDPPHLLPFLKELSTDERLPLIARNHTAKLLKQIEKSKKQ